MSQRARIFFLLLNLLFAIPANVAFFAWTERNASLPWLGAELGWPWAFFPDWGLPVMLAWNVGLFFAFGLFHSALAQPSAHRLMARLLPPQSLRTIYLAISGAALLAMMGLWQNTGRVIWALPLPQWAVHVVSFVVFWTLIGACGWLTRRFGSLNFWGLRQIYSTREEIARGDSASSGPPALCDTGVYGIVRHPIYTLTILALVLTPVMTLDRLVLLGAMLAYLAVGIPIEERKLIGLFGPAYARYRERVPALIPAFRIFGRVS
jgi:protein-S-isoprenylcysteine O-methyltransferase Ste14